MSACVTYITRITQVTLKTINNTLLIYNWWLCFLNNYSSCSIFRLTNTGWMVVWIFRLKSLSCFLTISAEVWSLNGKATRIVSSVSWGGDKGCCWSQTFESTKLLRWRNTGWETTERFPSGKGKLKSKKAFYEAKAENVEETTTCETSK